MDVPIVLINHEELTTSSANIESGYSKWLDKVDELKQKGKDVSKARNKLMSYKYLRSSLGKESVVEFMGAKFCIVTPEFNFEYKDIANILDDLDVEFKAVIR